MATTGTIAATQLNFRSAPDGTKPNIIRALPKGTVVEIISEQGEWLKVKVAGQVGFLSGNFVHRDEEKPPHVDAPVPGNAPSLPPGPTPVSGTFKLVGSNATAPDGTRFGKAFKLGVFNFGDTSISAFVGSNPSLFAGLPPSRLRVMQAVSENEGKLEAINTWDSAFLTFGIFQWTVGTDSGPGELPSLIARLKRKSPTVYQKYFGQFGLDVVDGDSQPGTLPIGHFTLNGTKLNTPALKQKLRTLDWAYRFWLAGHDPTVCQVQIEHALERVDLFYRSERSRIGNRFIADYVSSECGVALLLDQHVNRPGHVPGTLARAVERLRTQLGDTPERWTDAEEKKLLDTYIQLRAQTSMTDSDKRAATIRKAVTAGLASDRRGSYKI